MKSQTILLHKRIKNSPLKSPSPDYIPGNLNTKTTSPKPLQDSKIFRNTQMKPQTVSFPNLPLQLMNKNKKIGVQNIQPVLSPVEKSIKYSTTLTKHQKNIYKQHTQTSQFVLYNQKSDDKLQQLFKLIEEIYGLISKRLDYYKKNQYKEINKIQKAFQHLQIIKQQFVRSTNQNHNTNDQLLFYQGQKKHSTVKPLNIIDSLNIAKKNNQNIEDQGNYIMKNHQLASKNNRLISQIAQLKQQLRFIKNFGQISQQKTNKISQQKTNKISQQKTNKNISQTILQKNQGQDINLTTFKFLRQKISYLQNELQNKIYKCQQLQKQKIEQKNCMKNSMGKKNQILQQQIKNYKNLVQIQKTKLIQLEQTNKSMDKNYNKIEQQISNSQRIQRSKKKNLHWQKSQVLSIEDLHQNSQQQQQSIITAKIKFNTQNQNFSIQDTHKYRNYLYHLQNQLENIKKFLQKCNKQLDISCLKCQQYQKQIISQTIVIIQLSTQTKILKQQIQQQKFQNQKLRQIIQKNIKLDINNSQTSKKPKRKGFQKIQKKNLENNSSKKQYLDFQPSLDQIQNPKKLMTRSVIYGEREENLD